MENNIFEGAKFGDRYITSDGVLAIVLWVDDGSATMLIENKCYDMVYRFNKFGITEEVGVDLPNIVSRYKEPIDEEKLDELANEYVEGGWNHMDMASRRDFKAGYRKAKEE